MDFQTKDKIGEKEIILELLREISRKFLVEFKAGEHKKFVYHGNFKEEVIMPDSRQEAIQGVELLTHFLKPYFDDPRYGKLEMNKKHKKLQEDIKKLVEKETREDEFIRNKLILLTNWFGELVMLVNKTKYLGKKKSM